MTLILSGSDGLSDIDGSAATPAVRGTDANTGIFFPAADTIAFAEGGAEAMRINSSGFVGIGTTSPAAPLHISGVDVDLNAFRIVSTTGTNAAAGRFVNTGGTAYIGLDNSTGSRIGGLGYSLNLWHEGAYSINFGTSNSQRASIDSSGGFILVGSTAQKATGTTWSNPSDFRLKDNIRDYGKGLAELMRVRVREWEYNGKGGTVEGTKGLGVVADEVMVVLPDTVENYEVKLNADDEEVTAIKKFDATEITWLLVKTVQEQQALITALTTRITALEGVA